MSSFNCHRCGKPCKSTGGLTNHLKSCISKIKNKPEKKIRSIVITLEFSKIQKTCDEKLFVQIVNASFFLSFILVSIILFIRVEFSVLI